MKKKVKFKDLTNKILFVILLGTLIANGVQMYLFNPFERFDWTTTVVSSAGNIVQVSDCYFNGNSYRINKNMILNSWETKNNSENEKKNTLLPDSLSIKWFSYNEQKFYSGFFSLPYESILKKAKQLGITYSTRNDYHVYIVAEVEPKGKVSLWIQKYDKKDKNLKLKITTLKAKETKETWNILDDYSQTNKTSDADIVKKVALVMEQHFYKLEIKLPSGYLLSNSYFKLYNQSIWYSSENDFRENLNFNFLPKEINLQWGNGKKRFSTKFYFDEDEVLNAFRKESSKSELLVLELNLSDRYNFVKASLINKKTNSKIKFNNKY
ncbi:DUF2931 family protein [Flavobacterium sp. 2]|uniref:DUF2931 family protein n=1 Tax=Flavobacterium sp. 2 TaxID=308053 RepID=UPI003CF4F3F2